MLFGALVFGHSVLTWSADVTSMQSIAVSGMSAAQLAMQASAHNIANQNSAHFRRQQVVQAAQPSGGTSAAVTQAQQPGGAIETDLVALLEAKNAFLANLAVFRAGERTSGSLLDAVS
jgi:flagellar basal body rod protein FlgC